MSRHLTVMPDRETFKSMSEQGNLVPVFQEILADLETPVSAFLKLDKGPYGFLLESELKQAKGVQLQDLQAYR